MTNYRIPGSFEEAALKAIRLLGAKEIARVTGKSAKTIRDYSDPKRAGNPSLLTAARIDAACFAAGAEMPYLHAYTVALNDVRGQVAATKRRRAA